MGNTTKRSTCVTFASKVASFGTMSSAYSCRIFPRKDLSLEESTLVSASMRRSPEESVVISSMGMPLSPRRESRREDESPRLRLLRCFWRERRRDAMNFMLPVVSVVSVRRFGSASVGAVASSRTSPPPSASPPRTPSQLAGRRASPASITPAPFGNCGPPSHVVVVAAAAAPTDVAASRKGSSPPSARSLRMRAARFAELIPRAVETNLPSC
mmetsp:Transcript_31116/g.59122  ORF Transcript_31116/g.59122 Transcript_31116/m.59122 type:complete len:213 (+) Transcript_31116:502-1140(+)